MILIVDNYDSFTFNIVQCVGSLGYEPVVIRNDDAALISDLSCFSAIVLSPGPCTPDDAAHSVDVVRRTTGRVPILGICLGHQCIARAFGAEVRARRPVVHGKASLIEHDGGAPFEDTPSPLAAARYHSLVVEEATLPADLLVSARTVEDGVLMGLRHRVHPTYGVQFHPESYLTPVGPSILANFLRRIPCSTSPTG